MRSAFPRHGGDLAWASRRYGLTPGDFLDFSANVNPLGPPPAALEAARASLSGIAAYPEPAADSLRRDLAGWLGVDPGLLTLGNGSSELIHHLVRCLAPRRVAVVAPAFGEYEGAARAAGAEVAFHQLEHGDGFSLDREGLAALAARAGVTFFCNPASPTGRLYPRRELLPALEACRESGGVLAVDESFMGFCSEEEAEEATLMAEAGGGNLVVISTLTKLFALAGLRGPGWLAGPEALVADLEGRGVPWRVNAVAAAAARACLEDRAYAVEARVKVAAWREDFAALLRGSGMFQVYPSAANYLLLRVIPPAPDAREVADALGGRGVLVRLCHDFRGLEEGFIRVAVRKPPENERLIEALQEFRAPS